MLSKLQMTFFGFQGISGLNHLDIGKENLL
jgi:hypothetical protein